MTNDSRSTHKVKEDENSNSNKKVLDGKRSASTASVSAGTDTCGLRRSARETSSRKQMTESPLNMRKSERLEKRMPSTPEVEKKSEKAEIQTMRNPLRRSDRGKKHSSPSSSGSKKLGEDFASSDTKEKREKDQNNLKQLTVDTDKVIRNETQEMEFGVRKRKVTHSCRYKALFKSQRIMETDDKGLQILDTLPQVDRGSNGDIYDVGKPDDSLQIDSSSNRGCGSKSVEEDSGGGQFSERQGKDLVEKCIEKASEGPIGVVGSDKKSLNVLVEVEASHSRRKLRFTEGHNGSLCKDGIRSSENSGTAEDSLDDTAAILAEHSKMDSGPQLASSKSAGKSPDGGSPNGDSEDSESGATNISSNRNMNISKMDSDSCAVTTNKDTQTSRVNAASSPLSRKHNSIEACATCFEKLRLGHDIEKHEGICMCHTTLDRDLCGTSIPKERGILEPSDVLELEGSDNATTLRKGTTSDVQVDYSKTMCIVCNLGGKLILCDGKGCKRSYHPSCLDHPFDDVPPRVWHCPNCVQKKIKSGVQSVSEGIESIWDSREVEVLDAEGLRKQKQYLVKYKGLAHVHNQWIPAPQLLLEAPLLLTKFDRKNQVVKYNAQWTVPHRLLKKRLLMSLKQQNDYNSKHPGKTLKCHYEWLVKWRSLSYVDATWELENASFLCSTEGQRLIRDYENRCQKGKGAATVTTPDKTKKNSTVVLSEHSTDCPPGIDNSHLRYAYKLLECWSKRQSAVVFDYQERVTRIILFILSVKNVSHPFLVIATQSRMMLWENEFSRLAPSINFVVYNGSKENRESIRIFEFYGEDNQIIFQVLLSSLQAFVEDSKVLERIRWEAVIVDDCRCPTISSPFHQIKTMLTETKMLLFNSPLKENVTEHRNVLSLLGSEGNMDDVAGSKTVSDDNLGRLKECLSRFIAYDCISHSSRFVEYWVPVRISNMQLEQYCATLLSSTMALCSFSKTDPVGALRDVLVSSLKCCDHPYIVDPILQSSVTKDLPPAEYLDIGIKASGKLQLLDIILSELKKRQQRVLILFQPITGTGKEPISIGDILDDFVRQRFGQDSYERVDGGVIVASKRQAALNNFNKDKGRFIFLLEHRACLSSIKLSSVDTIIIYDSDLNPMNDLRALQKITIDAQPEQIRIFRLYACCTVEEAILLKADHDLPLDSKLQNLNRSTSDTLLMWGASYLFNKLDEFHSSSVSNISCEQSELNNVVEEILDIFSQNCKPKDTTNSIITRAELSGGSYSTNRTLVGKLKVQLQEREQPNTFWRKLLEGRNPRWKYIPLSTPRQRKRIHYSEKSPRKTHLGNEEVAKKQKKMVDDCTDPAPLNPGIEEGTSGVPANVVTQSVPTERVRSTEVQQETAVAEKGLSSLLKLDVSRLCQILKLSGEINAMIERVLEYIVQNHRVSREPASILQAFLISLCWIGASLLKHKIDKKESLGLAKKHMKFNCTEEEAISVYSKLKQLKEMFLSSTQNIVEPDSLNDSQRASDATATEPLGISNSALLNLQGVKLEIEEGPGSQCFGVKLILAKQGQSANSGIAKKGALDSRKQVQRESENQMLAEKHQKELEQFNIKWENKKIALKKVHIADSALIRVLYSNLSVRLGKLKALDNEFDKKMQEYKRLRDIDLEDLKAQHSAEERQTTTLCLEEAKFSTTIESRAENEPTLHDSQSRKQVENSEASEYGTQSGTRNVLPLSRQLTQRQSLDEVGNNLHSNSVVVADVPETPSDGTVGCNIPVEGAIFSRTPHSGNDNEETMASEKGSATLISHPSEGGCLRDSADSIVATSPHLENHIQLSAECETAPNEVLKCLDSVDMGTPPIESNNEKSGVDASAHDMPNADGMQNNEFPCSNGCNPPACDRPLLADLDVQNDCPRALSCSRTQGENVQGTTSSSPQVDSPLQPVATRQRDQANADGHVEEPPDGVNFMLSANANHSQSQPNFLLVGGVVDVPSFPEQIIPNDSTESHQLADESADVSDNVILQDGENLESQPLIAELPIGENQPERRGGETLYHEPLGGLQNSSQNAEALQLAVEATIQVPSLSGLHTEPIIHNNSTELHQLAEESADVSDNVILQDGENLEAQPLTDAELPIGETHPELPGGDTLDHEPLEGLQNSSQNAEVLPQAVEATIPVPSLSGSHTGPNLPIVQGSDSQQQVLPRLPPATLNSADPLQIELERLRKEMEHVTKFHEDTKLRLKSECDKEIAEAVAQINSKYESKRQDAEAELLLKRKELDTNHNKVLMNKVLADAFRSKCLDLRPSGAMGLQHAVPSSFLQQLRQLSTQTAPRPPPVVASSSAVQPSVSQHTTTPPPLQFVNNSAALFSSSSTRPPPSINPITPSAGNVRVSGEIRSPAPHIQPFRPSTSVSPSPLAPLTRMMPSQHAQGSLPPSRIPPLATIHSGLTSNHAPNPPPATSPATAEASSHQRSRSSSQSPSPSANLTALPSLQRSGSLSGTSPSLPQPSSPPPLPPSPLPTPLTNQSSLPSLHTPDSLPSTSFPSQPKSLPSLPPLLANPSGLYNRPPQLRNAGASSSSSSAPNNLNASSLMGLFMENNNQAAETTQPNFSPPLPDFGSNFESWDPSQFGTMVVNEPVTAAPSTVATDVVCLSDDD